MRFLTGVAIGGAIGYVMGTKAGREQYDLMVEKAIEVLGEDTIASMKAKLGATVDSAGEESGAAAD